MATWMDFQGPTFTMNVPSDWYITSTIQFQVLFLGLESDNGIRPNLSISMRPVQEDVTPTGVAEQTRIGQKENYQNYIIISEDDFTGNGGFVFLRRYTWHNTESGIDVHQTQLFAVYNQMLYTLTATRALEDQSLEDTIVKMIQSFRVVL